MSIKAMAWVDDHAGTQGRPVAHNILYRMADQADDDGDLTGDGFGSINNLSRRTRYDRKTVMHAIAELEQLGELLIRRPADRGYGRHNDYVVLMGRDPRTVADARGWSRPADRSPSGTYPASTPSAGHGPAEPTDPAADPVPAARPRLRLAEPVPSGTPTPGVEEPVDSRPAGVHDRSLSGTYPPSDRSWTGPGPVPSDGPFPSSQIPKSRLPAARATRPVDKLDQVEQTLTDRGVAVVWDLGTEQRSELVAHLERWPAAAGVTALVAHAEASIRAHGLPRSARAWVGGWLGLRPPSPRSAATECATHRGQPADNCACCRADLLAGIS